MKRYWILATLILSLGAACSKHQETPQTRDAASKLTNEIKSSDSFRRKPLSTIETVTISVNGHSLKAYIADEFDEQQEGLMFVTSDELKQDDAMIFVFDAPAQQSFWMRNTIIPLDIAYLDSEGRILNILTMKPLDESGYPSAGPAQYAVETNAGWFAEKNITAGAKFDLSNLTRRN